MGTKTPSEQVRIKTDVHAMGARADVYMPMRAQLLLMPYKLPDAKTPPGRVGYPVDLAFTKHGFQCNAICA